MQRDRQQQRGRNCLQRIAQQHNRAAVIAVGDMARGQHEDDARKKERESRVAELQRRVRDLVHMPRNAHGLRFRAHYADQARRRVEAKITRPPGDCCARFRLFPFRHLLLCSHTCPAAV